MKVKELIRLLQEEDPSGELEVFSGGDIYSVQRLPWYYDGKPGILIRDPAKAPFYDVVGMRQITPEDKAKIYLQSLSLADVVADVDNFEDLQLSGDERFMTRARESFDKHQKAMAEWYTKTKKDD